MNKRFKAFTVIVTILLMSTFVIACGQKQPDSNIGNTTEDNPSPTSPPVLIETPDTLPTASPTNSPVEKPTVTPTTAPTAKPNGNPVTTTKPTVKPSQSPTSTEKPTVKPSQKPVSTPKPTVKPTQKPVGTPKPTQKPISTPKPTKKPVSTPKPNKKPSSVKLNHTSYSLTRDKEIQLKLLNTSKKVTWKSSNSDIVLVASNTGWIRGMKLGSATITATCDGKKYTCKVTVKENAEWLSIEENFSKHINNKRKEKGLHPLTYVSSGSIYNCVKKLAYGESYGSMVPSNIFANGFKMTYRLDSSTNFNKLFNQFSILSNTEMTHITFYTKNAGTGINTIYAIIYCYD